METEGGIVVSGHKAHEGSKNWLWGCFQKEPRDAAVHRVCRCTSPDAANTLVLLVAICAIMAVCAVPYRHYGTVGHGDGVSLIRRERLSYTRSRKSIRVKRALSSTARWELTTLQIDLGLPPVLHRGTSLRPEGPSSE
jgi:hypothetical protein